MRIRWLTVCALGVIGCGSDPVPATPGTDGGMDSATQDRPAVDTGTPGTDAGFTDVRPTCQMGSYVPCECSPGNLGIHRCIMGTVESVCECDGGAPMDASP